MRRRAFLWTALAAVTLVGGASAYRLTTASRGTAGGPIDPNRPDCPGLIECPLTGEPVCADRCPLGSDSAESTRKPSCCRKAQQ